jgi:hypothetical protein
MAYAADDPQKVGAARTVSDLAQSALSGSSQVCHDGANRSRKQEPALL